MVNVRYIEGGLALLIPLDNFATKHWNNEFSLSYLALLIESRNVNLQGGPVSITLTNVLQILNSCDNLEVDVLPQVRTSTNFKRKLNVLCIWNRATVLSERNYCWWSSQSVRLSVGPPDHPSLYLSLSVCVCLIVFLCLYVCLSVFLCLPLCVCLSIFVFLYVCLQFVHNFCLHFFYGGVYYAGRCFLGETHVETRDV